MNHSRLVSIVIPCFNHGQFLAEAITSALSQSYADVEVIVVDDGSTDDTASVASRFPVRTVRQVNQGLAAAGNAGVRASQGEFVMRLDADDRLVPTYVEETTRLLLENPSLQFVYTQVRYFGARIGSYPVEDFDPESLAERNYVHASAMMRRAAFDAVGGYSVDMRGLRCEDWDLWLSFAEHGFRGKLIAKPLLEYRQHPGPSMVTIDVRSLSGLRRELTIANRLYMHHRRTFAPAALVRRLRRLPRRLARRETTPRFAVMLLGFYAVLLLQHALVVGSRLGSASTADT